MYESLRGMYDKLRDLGWNDIDGVIILPESE